MTFVKFIVVFIKKRLAQTIFYAYNLEEVNTK